MKYVDKLFGVFQRLHRSDEFRAPASAWPTSGASFSGTAAGPGREGEVDHGATFYFSLPEPTSHDRPN